MEAVCAVAAVAGMLWLPAPLPHPPSAGVDRAWSAMAGPAPAAPALDVAAPASRRGLQTGGLALSLPREAVALRRAAQALGYVMPDPEAAPPPTSATLIVDPKTIEFRSGTRLCLRYATRF